MNIPNFKSEAEEADWWDSHEDELADEFEKAASEGRLTIGTIAKSAGALAPRVPLDPEDISKAHYLAEKKGIRYQTYLKMLLHEALQEEESKLRKIG